MKDMLSGGMRRSDRQITELNDILDVLNRCDTLRLGINGEGYPYVVPVSFGYEALDGRVTLYFHGAGEGLKHELLARDPRVCAEADIMLGFRNTGHSLTCEYESVIGFGRARRLEGAEALHGLELLNAHCGYADFDMGDCVPMTTVYAVELEAITGKRRRLK